MRRINRPVCKTFVRNAATLFRSPASSLGCIIYILIYLHFYSNSQVKFGFNENKNSNSDITGLYINLLTRENKWLLLIILINMVIRVFFFIVILIVFVVKKRFIYVRHECGHQKNNNEAWTTSQHHIKIVHTFLWSISCISFLMIFFI